MPNAFNNVTMNSLNNNIRALYYRRKKVGKLYLTFNEYLNTFVPREVRGVFQEIAPWLDTSRGNHRWELFNPTPTLEAPYEGATEKIQCTMQMHVHHNKPMPPPIVRMPTIQADAPKEVTERIYTWATHGGDVSREFGRVAKVLEILNASYSRTAIRYYWPTILAICSESNATKELVQEMQELRTPAKLKPLLPGLPQACRLTAETIATARLIPADIEEVEGEEITIDTVSGQTYKETVRDVLGVRLKYKAGKSLDTLPG